MGRESRCPVGSVTAKGPILPDKSSNNVGIYFILFYQPTQSGPGTKFSNNAIPIALGRTRPRIRSTDSA